MEAVGLESSRDSNVTVTPLMALALRVLGEPLGLLALAELLARLAPRQLLRLLQPALHEQALDHLAHRAAHRLDALLAHQRLEPQLELARV